MTEKEYEKQLIDAFKLKNGYAPYSDGLEGFRHWQGAFISFLIGLLYKNYKEAVDDGK